MTTAKAIRSIAEAAVSALPASDLKSFISRFTAEPPTPVAVVAAKTEAYIAKHAEGLAGARIDTILEDDAFTIIYAAPVTEQVMEQIQAGVDFAELSIALKHGAKSTDGDVSDVTVIRGKPTKAGLAAGKEEAKITEGDYQRAAANGIDSAIFAELTGASPNDAEHTDENGVTWVGDGQMFKPILSERRERTNPSVPCQVEVVATTEGKEKWRVVVEGVGTLALRTAKERKQFCAVCGEFDPTKITRLPESFLPLVSHLDEVKKVWTADSLEGAIRKAVKPLLSRTYRDGGGDFIGRDKVVAAIKSLGVEYVEGAVVFTPDGGVGEPTGVIWRGVVRFAGPGGKMDEVLVHITAAGKGSDADGDVPLSSYTLAVNVEEHPRKALNRMNLRDPSVLTVGDYRVKGGVPTRLRMGGGDVVVHSVINKAGEIAGEIARLDAGGYAVTQLNYVNLRPYPEFKTIKAAAQYVAKHANESIDEAKKLPDYDMLPLVPTIIADDLVSQPFRGSFRNTPGAEVEELEAKRQALTIEQRRKFADMVEKRCQLAHKAKVDWWVKIVMARGNAGRDKLRSLINHWLHAYLKSPETFMRGWTESIDEAKGGKGKYYAVAALYPDGARLTLFTSKDAAGIYYGELRSRGGPKKLGQAYADEATLVAGIKKQWNVDSVKVEIKESIDEARLPAGDKAPKFLSRAGVRPTLAYANKLDVRKVDGDKEGALYKVAFASECYLALGDTEKVKAMNAKIKELYRKFPDLDDDEEKNGRERARAAMRSDESIDEATELNENVGPVNSFPTLKHYLPGHQGVYMGKIKRFDVYSLTPCDTVMSGKMIDLATYKKGGEGVVPDDVIDSFDIPFFVTSIDRVLDKLRLPKLKSGIAFVPGGNKPGASGWVTKSEGENAMIYAPREPSSIATTKYGAFKGPRSPHSIVHEYGHKVWWSLNPAVRDKLIAFFQSNYSTLLSDAKSNKWEWRPLNRPDEFFCESLGYSIYGKHIKNFPDRLSAQMRQFHDSINYGTKAPTADAPDAAPTLQTADTPIVPKDAGTMGSSAVEGKGVMDALSAAGLIGDPTWLASGPGGVGNFSAVYAAPSGQSGEWRAKVRSVLKKLGATDHGSVSGAGSSSLYEYGDVYYYINHPQGLALLTPGVTPADLKKKAANESIPDAEVELAEIAELEAEERGLNA